MNLSYIIRYTIIGSIIGFTIAVLGIAVRLRRVIKDGIYVETKNLKRNRYLHSIVSNIRPFCQIDKFSVHSKFKDFVHEIDELTGDVLINQKQEKYQNPLYLQNIMNMLRQSVLKGTLKIELENQLQKSLEQLLGMFF
jgi:lysyl-tRNA synthetase class I